MGGSKLLVAGSVLGGGLTLVEEMPPFITFIMEAGQAAQGRGCPGWCLCPLTWDNRASQERASECAPRWAGALASPSHGQVGCREELPGWLCWRWALCGRCPRILGDCFAPWAAGHVSRAAGLKGSASSASPCPRADTPPAGAWQWGLAGCCLLVSTRGARGRPPLRVLMHHLPGP